MIVVQKSQKIFTIKHYDNNLKNYYYFLINIV